MINYCQVQPEEPRFEHVSIEVSNAYCPVCKDIMYRIDGSNYFWCETCDFYLKMKDLFRFVDPRDSTSTDPTWITTTWPMDSNTSTTISSTENLQIQYFG